MWSEEIVSLVWLVILRRHCFSALFILITLLYVNTDGGSLSSCRMPPYRKKKHTHTQKTKHACNFKWELIVSWGCAAVKDSASQRPRLFFEVIFSAVIPQSRTRKLGSFLVIFTTKLITITNQSGLWRNSSLIYSFRGALGTKEWSKHTIRLFRPSCVWKYWKGPNRLHLKAMNSLGGESNYRRRRRKSIYGLNKINENIVAQSKATCTDK